MNAKQWLIISIFTSKVFENFRKVCRSNYNVNPAWYFTAPGLAWDAALKETNISLDLLEEPDMLLMIEKGIRGGVSMILKRYAKPNNKYVKDFKQEEESKFIAYLDANNLHGYGMSQKLPTSDFKWMNDLELEFGSNF